MALLITPLDIEPEEFTLDVSSPGATLAHLYRLLDCSVVQMVTLDDGRAMWMDEEAKLRSPMLPVNDRATALLHSAGGVPWDVVVGPVVITAPGEEAMA